METTTNIWKRILTHITTRPTLWLSVLVIIVAVLLCLQFPVYFRRDDAIYLNWAHTHGSPLSAFRPSQSLLLGFFRPINTIVWWCMYRLFGLNPFLYQMFVALAYGFSFVLFFKLVELIYNKRVALLALVGYVAVFFQLCYIVFWFSDLTFILEILLINLSLYLFVRAARGRGSFGWAALAYVCAFMSKEPSTVIVPFTAGFFVWSEWRDLAPEKRRQAAGVVAALLCAGVAWIIVSPSLPLSRHPYPMYHGFGLSLGLSGIAAFMAERGSFYAGHLISKLGPLIWISAVYLALRSFPRRQDQLSRMRFYLPLALGVVIAVVLKPFHGAALVVLLIALLVILAARSRESFAVVWFGLPLLGIMTLPPMVRGNLTEASFGLAVILGVALDDIVSNLAAERSRASPRLAKAVLAIGVVIVCLAIVAGGAKVKDAQDALRIVSATRQNFQDAVDFIRSNLNEPKTELAVVAYQDMGLIEDKDILPLGDLEKAHRQKTMEIPDVRRLLGVAGKQNIAVRSLGGIRRSPGAGSYFLFVMNKYEQSFVDGLGLRKEIVYKTERCGEGAWLYRVIQ